ncbi:MAG TPA: tetratricopeptide repeat protein, partial [Saprospiraceae bacterium]|nr:tetratricopeptide repeat protein [Saprospiraceae bacterium]
ITLASELDPVSMAILKDLGITCYYTRQYDKGIEKAKATLIMDPDFTSAHRLLSLCYERKGLYDLALEENQKWGELTHNVVKTKLAEAHILAASGKSEEARAIMAELIARDEFRHNDNRSAGLVYVALGENDRAFEWLDKSALAHEEALCNLKVDPKMDPIRNDPRFAPLVERIGLHS